jgi:hypothetical protein
MKIKYLFGTRDPSAIPNLSNSVYSMQVTPYSQFPSGLFFSISTLIPSVAPEIRSQDANPSFCYTGTFNLEQ